MYEGFSGQGRRAVELAYDETRRQHRDYIGTDHLVLGALLEESGEAARLLTARGVEPKTVIRLLTPAAPADLFPDRTLSVPFSPKARRALGYAREEAAQLKHPFIRPEHLLLGALRETD